MLNSLTELSISVDSINPDTYEKIHGNGETLPTVINNIKKCIEIKKKYNCKIYNARRFGHPQSCKYISETYSDICQNCNYATNVKDVNYVRYK